MTILTRACAPFAAAFVLPMLMASQTADAAPARKAVPVATAPIASKDIIALPLNPTVPAGQRVCEAKTASGLGYTLLRPATGPHPAESDFVLVNYIGYLTANGQVFDQGMQSAFPVNGVIPGFSEGLQLLAKTGVARLCIPAAIGYGPSGSGPIPPNADLVFQVELVDYKSAAEVQAMRKAREADQAAPKDPAAPPK